MADKYGMKASDMTDEQLWSRMTEQDLDQLWPSVYNVPGVADSLSNKYKMITDAKYSPENVFKSSKKNNKSLNDVLETLVNHGVLRTKIPEILGVLRNKMRTILFPGEIFPLETKPKAMQPFEMSMGPNGGTRRRKLHVRRAKRRSSRRRPCKKTRGKSIKGKRYTRKSRNYMMRGG